MLGLFFERLNSRLKTSEDISKESISNSNTKPSNAEGPLHTCPNLTSSTYKVSMTHTTRLATMGTNEDTSLLDPALKKMRNPSPIHSKKLHDDHDTQDSEVAPGHGEIHRKMSNFALRRLEKDPVTLSAGVIQDSTQEGSFLAQNIPTSKLMSASNKFNLADKNNRLHSQSKNKVIGESMDMKDDRMKCEVETRGKQGTQLQKAWLGWWQEKKKNNHLLLEASKSNNLEICKQLLDSSKGDLRGDVNHKDENGWSPLHFACLNENINLVNLLLYNGANIDSETSLKFTVLHIAAQTGQADNVQLLINSGASLNARDIFNNTPLHYAAQKGHKNIVTMLLSRPSVDFTIKNNDNKTAYNLAKDKEVQKVFEMFMTEKNLLNSKFSQKVTIHAVNPTTNTRKIFDITTSKSHRHISDRTMSGTAINLKPLIRKNEDFEIEDKRTSSHRSNITNGTGDTKTNSSLNTTESDNGNVFPEEERVGPNSFQVHGLIGKGSFGEVYLVEKKNTGIRYAMKVLHKSTINKHNLINYAMTERNVLGVTNHPFIVKLNYAFQTPEKLFLILDYCPGGDLSEHLNQEKRIIRFTEEKARFYLTEVVLALEDLHKRDIIFRDLKPDNIVIDAEGHAKLTDFGLSKEGVLDHSQGARSFCGSFAYLAPEMLRRTGHGKAVDWYLLGVVFYEMLVGTPPYYAHKREQLFYNIEKAPLKIPAHLTNEAKSLLKGLLQRNPTKRLGSGKGDAEEIKAHEFFRGIDWKEAEQRKLKPPALDKKLNKVSKINYDVFEGDPGVSEEHLVKVEGWSFVASHNQDQNMEKRAF